MKLISFYVKKTYMPRYLKLSESVHWWQFYIGNDVLQGKSRYISQGREVEDEDLW